MRWYEQPGTQGFGFICLMTLNGKLTIQLINRRQYCGTDSHKPYLIPISYQLIDRESGQILILETLFELSEMSTTVTHENVTGVPVISVLRGLSAPVKWEMTRPVADLIALARFDDDGVSRWDAIQDLYIQSIGQLLKDPTHLLIRL